MRNQSNGTCNVILSFCADVCWEHLFQGRSIFPSLIWYLYRLVSGEKFPRVFVLKCSCSTKQPQVTTTSRSSSPLAGQIGMPSKKLLVGLISLRNLPTSSSKTWSERSRSFKRSWRGFIRMAQPISTGLQFGRLLSVG